MMLNPYAGVDWSNDIQVKSVSHEHIVDQAKFDRAVARGYQHVAISHYNPSVPVYPLSESPYFTGVPDYMIGSPNTEKAKATNTMNHIICMGSFCEGYGVPDQATKPWSGVFEDVLSQLQYEDGGGIIIAHPGNSDAMFDLVTRELDYDHTLVLGIEMYNHCAMLEENRHFEILWDRILSTGRRCWGCSVVDWDVPDQVGEAYGSNILIVPEYTEHECLKAYRNGNFFPILIDTGLRFTNISASKKLVNASVNRNCTIEFITNNGVVKSVSGSSASYDVQPKDIYVRIKAKESGENEYICSNPIRYMDQDEVNRMPMEKLKRYASILLSD